MRISFLNQSFETKKVEKSLCPTWDQTVILEDIIYDSFKVPPPVVVEVYDHDQIVS